MRRLFGITSAFSMLICLAIVALWIWSYRGTIVYGWSDVAWASNIGSASGRLYFMASAKAAGVPSSPTIGWQRYPPFKLRLREPLPGEPGVRHH